MNKIKILFYSHTIDYGGTWRSHERILKSLDKNIFDVYVLYNPKKDNNRLDYVKELVDEDKLISFEASDEKTGPNEGYRYVQTNFEKICEDIKFDIIHFARSGYYEWPFTSRLAPLQIETNIFGFKDNSEFLDCSVTICETINNRRGGSDKIIFNPIPKKLDDYSDLRSRYQIPDNFLIFGRIGRKDNFHPIALNAIAELKKERNDFKYLIVGACDSTKAKIKELGLEDVCVTIEPTNDDFFIHQFYNSLDLFLHYRSDGECHSTAISQSLAYGVPVISHYAGYNGQEETIKNGGYVVNNEIEYLNKIKSLISNFNHYQEISMNAFLRFEDFNENKINKEWETLYLSLYLEKTK